MLRALFAAPLAARRACGKRTRIRLKPHRDGESSDWRPAMAKSKEGRQKPDRPPSNCYGLKSPRSLRKRLRPTWSLWIRSSRARVGKRDVAIYTLTPPAMALLWLCYNPHSRIRGRFGFARSRAGTLAVGLVQ